MSLTRSLCLHFLSFYILFCCLAPYFLTFAVLFRWLDSLSVHFLFYMFLFVTWFSSPAFSFLNVSYRWFDSLSLHCLSLMFRSVDAFLHYKLIYWLLYFLNNQRQLEIYLKLLNNRTRTKISKPKLIFNNFLALKKSISEKNVFKLLTCWW